MKLCYCKLSNFKRYAVFIITFWLMSFTASSQTTLAAGDIAFVGYISTDDGVNGTTQDDEFSFILLKDITAGTVIKFTDFGWLTAGGFQTANPCGANTGAINDGIITWTASSNMSCGTQVRIKCKYTLVATAGTVSGTQACNNDVNAFLSLANGGDQIFAYQGTHASPALLAGININAAWDVALANCFFSSNSSILPAVLVSGANNVAVTGGINAKYNCAVTYALPPFLITAINTLSNWQTDNTFFPTPVPVAFQLPLSCTFGCTSCIPLTTNGCANGDSLGYFSLKGALGTVIYNESGPTCNGSPLAYSDYTAAFSAVTLVRGESFGGFMRTGNANDYATIWIDANDNGAFENSERLMDNLQIGTVKKLYTLYIPAGTALGTHRMRVRVVNYPVTPAAVTDPCSLYANGETEDYLVAISNVGSAHSVATGTPGTCMAGGEITIGAASNNNISLPVPIVDSLNNYIAAVYPIGNNLGTVKTSYYVHNGPLRQDAGGRYYLDRNVTVSVGTQAASPYSFRYFFLNSELNALIVQPGSGVTSIFDLSMTKTATNTCQNSFVTNLSTFVSPTGFGSLLGDRFVDFTGLTSFSSFFLHGGTAVLQSSPLVPQINVVGTLVQFNSCSGSPSAEQSFSVSGTDLTTNLVITAPADFEISLTSGSGFTNSISLIPSSGAVAVTTIYTRMSASAVGSPSGAIICTSLAIATQSVAVSGVATPITASNAGPDASPCGLTYTLAGNTPSLGTGTWTQVAGPGTSAFTNANSPTSGVTVTVVGAYTFRWTIANPPCSSSQDDVVITFVAAPTTSNAGSDASQCGLSYTLAGNTPLVGTGTWTQTAGPGTSIFTNANSPTSGVTVTIVGAYTFRWTIANAPCPSSQDDVIITFVASPSTSNAGPDAPQCGLTYTLAGNTASTGTGTWTQTAGPGTSIFTNANSETSGVTVTVEGAYTFRWTIATGAPCPDSQDDLIITFAATPTVANAGADRNLCLPSTSLNMAGNTPTEGTGTWTQTGGPVTATIITPGSPTTGIAGMTTAGTYTFRWTISNAPCTASFDEMDVVVNVSPPVPTITGGGVTVCPGTTVTLSGPIDPNYTYNWERSMGSNGAAFNSVGTGQTLNTTVSGVFRLIVTNQFGCSATSAQTIVHVADYVFNGSIGAGDAQQNGRINRFGQLSTCAVPTACPGIFSGPGLRFYDSYTITNPRGTPVCATIGTNNPCGTNIFTVAYLGSFDPNNLCTNYLGDPGSSFSLGGFFEVTIPANGTIVVVVHEVNVGQGCSNYTLTVDVPRDLSPIAAVPPSVVCNGTSVLTAPVANSYLWSPGGATTQSITTPPLFVPTTFSVTLGYGNNGCTRSDNVTVGVTSLPPTISCPANVSLNNTTGQCGRTVTYTTIAGGLPAPTVTYAFTGATTASGSGDGSGSFFNVGTTTVTVTVTNSCGTTNCSFTVTVNDTELPTASNVSSNFQCPAQVPPPNPSVITDEADNCSPVPVVAFLPALTTNNGGAGCPGNPLIVTRFYSVTDASNNSITVSHTITIVDNIAPLVTVGTIQSCYPTVAAAEAAALAATSATDNCFGALTETASTVGTCSAVITVTTTDACGNATAVTYNTRIDNTAPIVTVGTISSCYPTVAAAEAAALAATSATDNCPGALVETASTVGTCSAVVTVTTTDACGNTTSVTYNTRIDNTAPIVTVGTISSCYPTVAAAEAAALAATSASDNCPGALVETASTVGTCSAVVTVTTTDACGNATSVTYNTRIDNTPPTLTCPAPVTVSCASAVPAPNIASVTGLTDNCPGTITVTHQGDVISAQTCTNRFTITRTYRATDVCGNFTECTQIITVNDQTAPVVICPANITATTLAGFCTVAVSFAPTATDNCGGPVTITSVPASGSQFSIGTTLVTVTAIDVCGNFSTCTFNVTVLDGQLPVISQHPVNRTVCAGTNATFSVTSTNAVSYQWQQYIGGTWTNITGQTSSSMTLNAVTHSMNTNTYRVNVIGLCTTVPSNAASLYVNPLPLINLAASIPPILLPGQTLAITATVSPTGGTFVWYKNNAVITGATGSSLTGLTVSDIGTYRAEYTDLNLCRSSSADLVVTAQPSGNLYVYPNPNNGIFRVRFFNQANEPGTVLVYNEIGARVYSQKFTATLPYTSVQVDISRLAAGKYLVEVVNSAGKRIGAKWIIVVH